MFNRCTINPGAFLPFLQLLSSQCLDLCKIFVSIIWEKVMRLPLSINTLENKDWGRKVSQMWFNLLFQSKPSQDFRRWNIVSEVSYPIFFWVVHTSWGKLPQHWKVWEHLIAGAKFQIHLGITVYYFFYLCRHLYLTSSQIGSQKWLTTSFSLHNTPAVDKAEVQGHLLNFHKRIKIQTWPPRSWSNHHTTMTFLTSDR